MEIHSVAEGVLRDADQYLRTIDAEIYSMPLDLLFGASIGQHTRHFIEFYQCLLDQIENPNPVINYALRKRDIKIEEDPIFASGLIGTIAKRLDALEKNVTCKLECAEYFSDGNSSVDSSLERELLYNIEHTIHHLAIIKIGLAAISPEIPLEEHFGVAPSTIKHKQGLCVQ